MTKQVIISFEPSKRLSELCGFPYLVESRFTTKELLDKGIIDNSDIAKMKQGESICKNIPFFKGGS